MKAVRAAACLLLLGLFTGSLALSLDRSSFARSKAATTNKDKLYVVFVDAPDPDNLMSVAGVARLNLQPDDTLYVVLTGRPVNLKHEWQPFIVDNQFAPPKSAPIAAMWWKKKEEAKGPGSKLVYGKAVTTNASDREKDIYDWDSEEAKAQQRLVQKDAVRRFRNYLVHKLHIAEDRLVIIDGEIAHDSPLVDEFHARDFFFDRPDLLHDQKGAIHTLCNTYGWLMRFRYRSMPDVPTYCQQWNNKKQDALADDNEEAEATAEAAGSRVLAPFEYFLLLESYNWLQSNAEAVQATEEERVRQEREKAAKPTTEEEEEEIVQEEEEEEVVQEEEEVQEKRTQEEEDQEERAEEEEEEVPAAQHALPTISEGSITSLESYATVWGLGPHSDLAKTVTAKLLKLKMDESVNAEEIAKITKTRFQELIESSCPESFKAAIAAIDTAKTPFNPAMFVYRYIGVCTGLEKALSYGGRIEKQVSDAIKKSHTDGNTALADMSVLREAIGKASKTVVVLGGPASGVSKLLNSKNRKLAKKISEIHGMWGAYLVGKQGMAEFGTTSFPNQFNVYADLPAAQRMTRRLVNLAKPAQWFLAPTETCKDSAFHLWNAKQKWDASKFQQHSAEVPYMYQLGELWTAIKPTDPWVPFDFIPAVTANPELRNIYKWYDVTVRSSESSKECEQHMYELCPKRKDLRKNPEGKCWAPQYCPCEERAVFKTDFPTFKAQALGANLPFSKVTVMNKKGVKKELDVEHMSKEAIPKAAQECSFALLMFALNEQAPAPAFNLHNPLFAKCRA
eukprot:GILK01000176.1.p1 GENE.GILK01000176.1~~GILK01000176.1.p1  ORF type:complete len:806 (-),score=166.15 GILK01000176.1:158-2530(-)